MTECLGLLLYLVFEKTWFHVLLTNMMKVVVLVSHNLVNITRVFTNFCMDVYLKICVG